MGRWRYRSRSTGGEGDKSSGQLEEREIKVKVNWGEGDIGQGQLGEGELYVKVN